MVLLTQVEVHSQLSNDDGHPVDGVLVGAGRPLAIRELFPSISLMSICF
jgi:hypothetical protein